MIRNVRVNDWFKRSLLIGNTAMLLIIAGCEVGPDYHAPAQAMPPAWVSPATTQHSAIVEAPPRMERWWKQFHDPTLDSLINRAIAANLDLQAAQQRIRAARAQVGIATAGLLPEIDSNGNYTRSGGGRRLWQSQWQAGLDAAWEIDIFGGGRRAVEQSDDALDAAVEDRRDVLVTLLGEVAQDYISLRGEQQQIVIAGQNLDVQKRNAQLARDKQRLGTGTDLDNAQADAQVATTSADIATLETTAQQTIYALSILLARPPTALDRELTTADKIPDPPTEIPVGLPSDLLKRRPDIRRAERQLAAATAGIGVAKADLFPKFSLTGNVGFQASHLDINTVNWNNSFWSFGPGVTWSVLDSGRIVSNIELQRALQQQTLVAYHQTVLTALMEVQNVLVSYAHEQQRRLALNAAVNFNRRAVDLSTRRYQQGQTDFLAVLDAERAMFTSEDALVQSNQAIGTDAVALYKALGGGWEIADRHATQ